MRIPSVVVSVLWVSLSGAPALAQSAADLAGQIQQARTDLAAIKQKEAELKVAYPGITSTRTRLEQMAQGYKQRNAQLRRESTSYSMDLGRFNARVNQHNSYCRGKFREPEYSRRKYWCGTDSQQLAPWRLRLHRQHTYLNQRSRALAAQQRYLSQKTSEWAASVRRYNRVRQEVIALRQRVSARLSQLAAQYGVAQCRGQMHPDAAHNCLAAIWDRARRRQTTVPDPGQKHPGTGTKFFKKPSGDQPPEN